MRTETLYDQGRAVGEVDYIDPHDRYQLERVVSRSAPVRLARLDRLAALTFRVAGDPPLDGYSRLLDAVGAWRASDPYAGFEE